MSARKTASSDYPLLPLHRRIRAARAAQLAAVEEALDAASPRADAVVRLETLLAHRDRLRSATTWPFGMRLLSRVVIYLVLPPLAWAGAALVERIVDRLIGA